MLSIPYILAAGSLFTLISGAPVPSTPLRAVTTPPMSNLLSLEQRDTFVYTTYGGDGETSSGWPGQDAWIPNFETMFANNKPIMQAACTQFSVPENSDEEMTEISNAINAISEAEDIDARFILAIMLQESNGCVRAPTTNYGVRNPGLMQDHDGSGTCNDNGVVSNPCPSSEITQMIEDGVAGTSSGDGLKQCLAESGATDVSMYYKAARIYNSGSIATGGNLGAGIATHCYASDIANRLTGWDSGTSECVEAAVADLTSTPSTSGNTPAAPVAAPAAPVAVPAAPASTPSSSSTVSSSSSASPASVVAAAVDPLAPAPANPDTSTSTSTTTSTSTSLSTSTSTTTSTMTSSSSSPPSIAAAAAEPPNPAPPAPTTPTTASTPDSDLEIVTITVTTYVVPTATASSAASAVPPASGTFLETSSSSSGSESGSTVSSTDPIYPYAIASCQEYYSVQSGDYCILVEQKYGITPAQFEAWNSGLDDQCTDLWLGYQYCVKA